MKLKKDQLMNKIIIVAMFQALCCAATFIQIRMPAGDFVHLGNFVMILSALLLGSVAGGLVGSVGMGLYDLLFYIDKPSTIIRTFILKFIIGFTVGYLFSLAKGKKINVKAALITLSVLFVGIFIASTVFFALGNFDSFSTSNAFASYIIFKDKKISISIYIPIFSFLFSVLLIFALIFNRKLNDIKSAVLFSTTIAILINIIGEFLLRWLLEGLMISTFDVALITATSKIPGSMITAYISVFLSVLIYEPVYKAVSRNSAFRSDSEIIIDEVNKNE